MDMPWAIAASCTTVVGRIGNPGGSATTSVSLLVSHTHTHRALHPALLPQNTFTIIHNEIPASFIIDPAHNFNASLLNCEQPCHLTAPIYSDIPVCCATYLGNQDHRLDWLTVIAFSFRAPYVVIISVPAGGYVITLTCPWDSPAETKHTDIVFNDQHVTRMRVTASLHKP